MRNDSRYRISSKIQTQRASRKRWRHNPTPTPGKVGIRRRRATSSPTEERILLCEPFETTTPHPLFVNLLMAGKGIAELISLSYWFLLVPWGFKIWNPTWRNNKLWTIYIQLIESLDVALSFELTIESRFQRFTHL